jgi:hypothetical protein
VFIPPPILDSEYKEAMTATISERTPTKRDKDLIHSALNQNFVFATLEEEHISLLISRMKLYELGPE